MPGLVAFVSAIRKRFDRSSIEAPVYTQVEASSLSVCHVTTGAGLFKPVCWSFSRPCQPHLALLLHECSLESQLLTLLKIVVGYKQENAITARAGYKDTRFSNGLQNKFGTLDNYWSGVFHGIIFEWKQALYSCMSVSMFKQAGLKARFWIFKMKAKRERWNAWNLLKVDSCQFAC